MKGLTTLVAGLLSLSLIQADRVELRIREAKDNALKGYYNKIIEELENSTSSLPTTEGPTNSTWSTPIITNTTSSPFTTEGPTNTTWTTPITNTTSSPFTTEDPGLTNTTSLPPVTEGPGSECGGVVVTGHCSFLVTGDLKDPAPLFTPSGIFDWLVPTPAGVVEIKNGQYIDMYCSDSFVAPFENATKITAQCLQGLYFLVNGTIFPFSNFSCTAWPTYTARRTGRNCSGGTDLLEVGFEVNGGFLQTMDICHDEINEVTRYVHHVLNPSSAAYQRSVARPRFIEGDFYAGKNVDNLYTKIEQNITISNILGMDASPYFNDTIDIYMARGHMAAKVDYIFGAPQMSTFFFVNVAPQWQAFNGGNWERVEDGVRKYVANNNLTTDCYTGIWGVSTLPDVNGTQRELYLAFDENNNGLIPVPKIYFRVVIDRATRKGIVLIGVNNPHASLEQILQDYVICEDVGNKIDWIQWAKEDLYKGYSYACSVPDFVKVVKHLPLADLETSGILGVEETGSSGCSFRVTGDLKDPAPLFTPSGVLDWVVPNTSGVVEIKSGASLDMYCSQSFTGAFENQTKVSAQCLDGFSYLVNGQTHNFSDFSCTAWPTYTARRTGRNCSGGTDLLEVGFEVNGGFLQTMDICHDEINEVTRYVHHVLNPSSAAYQRSVARPRFIEGDFYAGKNVDNLYTKIEQNITISNILGMDASPYFNDTIDIYMARGHMAAKVDYIFGAPQMSTFFFVNVAPQWQAFNGGNWERVEDGVRKYVANNNLTTDCYTGIWGVSTLPDVNGTQRELYLAFDENNNGLIPVPKIYFRVVIDRATRKGIVLIGVNNPHASLEQILQDYVICEDVGNKIDWIQWAKEDLYKGYSYACSVPDFVKVVKHLPLADLETSGILGVEETGSSGCSFRVTGDLKDPAPLFTPSGVLDWVVPNTSGVVEIKSGASLDMYCSQSFTGAFENQTKVSAQCLDGFSYLVNGQTHNFSDFSCTAWPTYTARRTGRNCSGGTDLLEVGFEVNGDFLQTMDICHDEINEVTRYVHHVLNPSSAAYQRSVARPRFVEGDFYAGKNVDNLYTKIQQNITISNILGMDASPYFNDTIDIYMARGHMAAKVDYIFGAPQMSTFFFVNVAPQWQAFNGGNWERVEDGVRKYVANNNLTTDCYTGIWGVSTLPDVNGTQRELYLAFDENNNGLIPVPKIYFRVVIDRATRKGIVLIGVNNPHASLEQILQEYVICEDVGNKIDWIQWAKEDLYKGYSYACSVPDFVKVVKHLPLADLETSGILGVEEREDTSGILGVEESETSSCSFRVSGDLNDPSPLFTPFGVYDWLLPTPDGVVELLPGEAIDMYCTKAFVAPFENYTRLTAQCLSGFDFLVDGQSYNFSSFKCSSWPTYTVRRTGRSCNGGTDLVEVGFEVDGGFLQTMDVCHDEVNEVTRYVHHILNPSSSAYQRSVTRPSFKPGDFYAGKNVDNLYTQVQQNITISNILGMDASPYFKGSTIYLARGHMAAKVDFIFGSPQRATFYFVNAAPQWQAFNAGNWERVEDGVRKYVSENQLIADCYTGVWGVSTLPDVNGTQKELYLAFDENNNGLIPVPKIYFRVVIDRASRKGIVLVGVNNPHLSLPQVLQEYVICEDIGHKVDWINWSKEDLVKGYSYACSVPDFVKVVKDLPLADLETYGILGVEPENSTCSFRVNGDLNDPSPLFTPSGVYDWLLPTPDGVVELLPGEAINMYCTKAFVAPFENYTRLTAQCLSGFDFLVDGQSYNFSSFKCSSWPTYTARRTGRSCNGGTDLVEVGFEVDGGFLQTMDVCHDEVNEVTRYVHHILNPSSSAYQRSVTRPSFKPGDFYAGKNVDNLYTQVQQNITISNILGMDASPYFNGSTIYLARGHMAAKVDFIFGSPQRATFYFVNAAPQWQAFNAGNWERVEDGVRKYVSDNNLTADCYTGVWGVSTLPDINGTQKELYLAVDENNNGLIPVPKIYFRVVIDRASRKGIVLVGVNNPHLSLPQVLQEYVICEDIGHKVDWINWTKEDLVKGYSYACSVPDFLNVVRHLPLTDLVTAGILGVDESTFDVPPFIQGRQEFAENPLQY